MSQPAQNHWITKVPSLYVTEASLCGMQMVELLEVESKNASQQLWGGSGWYRGLQVDQTNICQTLWPSSFPGGSHGRVYLQCGRPGFCPWVEKIPWRRAWQYTPALLPGGSLWTEEPDGLQSIGLQRVRWDWRHSTAHTPSFQKVRKASVTTWRRNRIPIWWPSGLGCNPRACYLRCPNTYNNPRRQALLSRLPEGGRTVKASLWPPG